MTELVTAKMPLSFNWKKPEHFHLLSKFSVNPITSSPFLKRSGNVLEAFEAIMLQWFKLKG